MHGFKNSFAQVFSLKSRSTISNICSCMFTNLLPTPTALPPFFDIQIWILCQFVKKIHSPRPPPPPPPPTPPPPPKKKNQIWILCQLVKKRFTYPLPQHCPLPTQNIFFLFFSDLDSLSKLFIPPLPPTPTSPTPRIFFFQIWILCQFVKKKNKNKKKNSPPPTPLKEII